MTVYTCDVCGANAAPIARPIEFVGNTKPDMVPKARIVIKQYINIVDEDHYTRAVDLCFNCYKRALTELYENLLQR